MTGEQYLLTGLSAVTSGLCFLFGLLLKDSIECKKDRKAIRKELETVKEQKGHAQGTLISFQNCPDKTCPFRRPPARYVEGQPIGDEPHA